jgi:hypothetical protein
MAVVFNLGKSPYAEALETLTPLPQGEGNRTRGGAAQLRPLCINVHTGWRR